MLGVRRCIVTTKHRFQSKKRQEAYTLIRSHIQWKKSTEFFRPISFYVTHFINHFIRYLYNLIFVVCLISHFSVLLFSLFFGNSVKTEILDKGANSSLLIAKINKSDSGNYTCSINSSHEYTVAVHVLNGKHFRYYLFICLFSLILITW